MTEPRVLNLDAVEDALKTTVEHVQNVMVLARGITTVEDEDSATAAAGILSQIADARKQVDAARLATSKPFRDEAASINDRFNEIKNPLAGIEEALRVMIADWRAKEEAKVAEANAAAEREYQAKVEEEKARAEASGVPVRQVAAPEMEAVGPLKTSTGRTVGAQSRWTYEILNEDAVPREFCDVSRSKLQKAVREGARTINGVRIYETQDTTVR